MKLTTAVKASVCPRWLSRSDEVRLAKRIKHGDLEAKERMIESNLVLVQAVAREY
jgi:DNA-directed RNA polymerase sigma subunit (sigma70/sigma32)